MSLWFIMEFLTWYNSAANVLDAVANCWSIFAGDAIAFESVKARTKTDENTERANDFIWAKRWYFTMLRWCVVTSSHVIIHHAMFSRKNDWEWVCVTLRWIITTFKLIEQQQIHQKLIRLAQPESALTNSINLSACSNVNKQFVQR